MFKSNTKQFKKLELPINYDEAHWSVRKKAREQYVIEQEGKCQHCGELLTGEPSLEVSSKPINMSLFPPHMFKHQVHLHHCHKSGLTIGAIHARCNAYLWQYLNQ